jgi:transglutaminase-like putative cysteine protease
VPDWRPALVALVPGLVIAQNWLRLERPQQGLGRALLLVVLALVPALAPRLWQRLTLAAVVAITAGYLASGAPLDHPGRAATRFTNGLLDFYDVRLPFNGSFHLEMHELVLGAAFGFTLALGLVAAARRPVAAMLVLVIGAGWPATLLSDGHDLVRGAAILAAALLLLAGVHPGAGRTFFRAGLVGAILVAGAVAATAQPAVAKSEFLKWQTWDPYTRPTPPVGVGYVWDANYDGFRWPRKTTTVLKVKAPPRSLYWRATTLDLFTGTRWVESLSPLKSDLFDGRLDLTQADPLATAAARDPANWSKAEVEIESLADNHLVAPSVPVAYGTEFSGARFWQGGVGTLSNSLEKGDHYPAWSYSPHPAPAQLAAVKARYPAAVLRYLQLQPGIDPPPAYATAGRDAAIDRFLALYPDYRALYAKARRVGGSASSPYGAALALESWLRTTGGFSYTNQPPPSGPRPLLDFVLRTKRGYCQHFAGAMALMLRYLGIPSRVAEGFVSGTYDFENKTWTVTDHDAHAWVEVWFAGFGWLPFDPTPGRGSLSAGYSISSPRFRPAEAAGLVGRVAGALLNTASIHQDLSFGDKDTGAAFLGANLVRTQSTGGTFGLQQRGGSLGKLLALVLALVVVVLAAAKEIRRRLRYAAADPRRQAGACRAELRDFLADQGIRLEPSAGPGELATLLREELEVDGASLAAALAAARFGPPTEAETAAQNAREELGRVRARMRGRLGILRRARGLVSLRSLGFAE